MADLPQLADTIFLTDGGIETTLIYQDGFDLPEFAAFVLLDTDEGRAALRRYFESYVAVAKDAVRKVDAETTGPAYFMVNCAPTRPTSPTPWFLATAGRTASAVSARTPRR